MSVFSPDDGQTRTDLCCSGSRPCLLCAVGREYGQGVPTDVSPHLISNIDRFNLPVPNSINVEYLRSDTSNDALLISRSFLNVTRGGELFNVVAEAEGGVGVFAEVCEDIGERASLVHNHHLGREKWTG